MTHERLQQKMNGISYELRENTDLAILSTIGTVFCVFDQNDSGNLSFGLENDFGQRYFVKIAGLETVHMTTDKETAIQTLKKAINVYHDLASPHLINLLDSFMHNDLFITVFDWFDGECLFDHWNFDYYKAHPSIISPNNKFRKLSSEQKINFSNKVLAFLDHVDSNEYAAIDFYDSSIIYHFDTNDFKVCDIDLFKKMPVINEIGQDFWGTKRMKSPEEYQRNAQIDSRTNVFKAGAFFMNLFGNFTPQQFSEMYECNHFIPVDFEHFSLSYELYSILLKSVDSNKEKRYQSIQEMKKAWHQAQIDSH